MYVGNVYDSGRSARVIVMCPTMTPSRKATSAVMPLLTYQRRTTPKGLLARGAVDEAAPCGKEAAGEHDVLEDVIGEDAG